MRGWKQHSSCSRLCHHASGVDSGRLVALNRGTGRTREKPLTKNRVGGMCIRLRLFPQARMRVHCGCHGSGPARGPSGVDPYARAKEAYLNPIGVGPRILNATGRLRMDVETRLAARERSQRRVGFKGTQNDTLRSCTHAKPLVNASVVHLVSSTGQLVAVTAPAARVLQGDDERLLAEASRR